MQLLLTSMCACLRSRYISEERVEYCLAVQIKHSQVEGEKGLDWWPTMYFFVIPMHDLKPSYFSKIQNYLKCDSGAVKVKPTQDLLTF
jgi:hypothetical protein